MSTPRSKSNVNNTLRCKLFVFIRLSKNRIRDGNANICVNSNALLYMHCIVPRYFSLWKYWNTIATRVIPAKSFAQSTVSVRYYYTTTTLVRSESRDYTRKSHLYKEVSWKCALQRVTSESRKAGTPNWQMQQVCRFGTTVMCIRSNSQSREWRRLLSHARYT